jgi:nifR3 family TIM-barrel protein
MFKIRDVIIDPPLVLAPMAGYTDSLFRTTVKRLGGCGLVFSELVSTEGMTRCRKRSEHLVRLGEDERPVAVQIFGASPARMAESAVMVEAMGADIIDINMGCPVKKVVRQGGGSNLMRDTPLMEKIFRAVRSAVRAPLTVKIRTGWDHDSINAVDVLKLAEDCGIEALTIHGRTRSDMFSGKADRRIIAEVKARAHVPIIGNGDVFMPEDAAQMFSETGVDGVMLGRGVLSNLWLIRQTYDHINGRPITHEDIQDRVALVFDLLVKMSMELPPPVVLGKLKKLGGCFSKGFPGSSRLRARMHTAKTPEEFFESIKAHLETDSPLY